MDAAAVRPPRRRGFEPAHVVLMAAVAFTLYLQTSIHGLVFATGDAGLKFLMTSQFAEGRWSTDLRLPAEPWVQSLWHAGLYPVPYPNVIEVEGRKRPLFSLAFPFVSALPYRLLGFRGLYVVPLLATWFTWLALLGVCRGIGASEAARAAAVAVLAFGTPLTFYSATFWEHAPAVALAFGGLALVLVEVVRGARPGRALLGGALIGTAPLLREESYLFAALLGGLAATVAWRPRFARLARSFLAGLLGTTLLVLLSNLVLYGHPLGLHAIAALDSREWATAGAAGGALRYLVEILFSHFPLAALVLPAAGVVLWKRRSPGAWVAAGVALLAVALCVGVPLLVRASGGRQWGPRFLLLAFPLLCLVTAVMVDALRRWERRWLRRTGYVAAAVLAVLGIKTNTRDAADYLFTNHRARMISLGVVAASESRIVAVSQESVALQLASQMGPKQFLLARRANDLRNLSRAAAAAGYRRFLYVCYPRYGCGRLEGGPQRLTFYRAGTSEPLIEFELGAPAGRYLVYEARIVAPPGAPDQISVLERQLDGVELEPADQPVPLPDRETPSPGDLTALAQQRGQADQGGAVGAHEQERQAEPGILAHEAVRQAPVGHGCVELEQVAVQREQRADEQQEARQQLDRVEDPVSLHVIGLEPRVVACRHGLRVTRARRGHVEALPATKLGPHAQVQVLQIREVRLVEASDVVDQGAAEGGHRAAGGNHFLDPVVLAEVLLLPPARTAHAVGVDEQAAGVEHVRLVVADDAAGQHADLGPASGELHQGLDRPGIQHRVVVDQQEPLAAGGGEGLVVAPREALVARVPDRRQPIATAGDRSLQGAVGRGVVDENDLQLRPSLREDRVDALVEEAASVEVDHDRGNQWSHGRP